MNKQQLEEKKYKKYFTHNNGNREFLVYTKSSTDDVYIYKQDKKYPHEKYSLNYNENTWMYKKKVMHIKNPQKVFIGKSPKIKMTKYSGGHGKEFDGNSILVCVKSNKYVFIGDIIYTFITKNDKINKFVSPVGNNDVPYPFAIGNKNVYNFVEPKGYIDKKIFKKLDAQNIIDKSFQYAPFYTNFNHTKKNSMTIKEFNKIKNTKLTDIPLTTLKQLSKMFNVLIQKNKQATVDLIEKIRGVVIYKKI